MCDFVWITGFNGFRLTMEFRMSESYPASFMILFDGVGLLSIPMEFKIDTLGKPPLVFVDGDDRVNVMNSFERPATEAPEHLLSIRSEEGHSYFVSFSGYEAFEMTVKNKLRSS